MKTKNKLAIHGHFYQPPRFNPLTQKVDDDAFVIQISNGKYKNWNQQINAECYKPNADAGNFELISFDFLRPLAEWMEKEDALTYKKIINADKHNYVTYGYGNAFGYPYNHTILPLLSEDDIDIEVYWGTQDFYHRYEHMPIAFWLPETAVDEKTLRILERNGIRFVILAPWQAQTNEELDTSQLYTCNLGEGRVMHIFFYNEGLSGDLSFDNSNMVNADTYVAEYLPTIVHQSFDLAALDGERFGHHLKGGEQFLKVMLRDLFNNDSLETINIIKEYFTHAPHRMIRIYENSAWSCHHGGLKRWQGDCDCCYDEDHKQRTNGYWKTALLSAFRVLSAELEIYFTDYAKGLINNLQALKREYIHVMQGSLNVKDLLAHHQIKLLSAEEEAKLQTLLEMQQYRLAMFTSCAFYWADIDRPEPRINIWNAKKTISLLKDIGEFDIVERLEKDLIHQLEEIYSSFTGKNGKDIYYEDGLHLSSI